MCIIVLSRRIYKSHFLILELGDYDYRGITTNNWPNPRSNTAVVNSIPGILPSALAHYRGNPIVPITMQLTRINLINLLSISWN